MTYIDNSNRAGWDFLYEHCFDGINEIIECNLKRKPHNEILVGDIFCKMLEALNKANQKMEQFRNHPDAKPNWTHSWDFTFNNIMEFSKMADTINKRVITINMIDQFLRATF